MLRNKANSKFIASCLFPVVILCLSFVIELGGDGVRAGLRYQSDWLQNTEVWRLFTGHFCHLGWSHFIMNAIGLVLIWFLFAMYFSLTRWIIIFIVCCLGSSLGFYFFDQNLEWYVGLSGVLHGLIIAGLMRSLYLDKTDKKELNKADILLLFAVLFKLVYEQLVGAVPFTELSSGGPVVVNAHLYGAIIGTMCALLFLVKDSYIKK